jgi:NTE family protein
LIAIKLERGRYTVKAKTSSQATNGAELERQPVWLVLGGGALKGLAHLGVWRALQELKIPVAGIVGTSAGAIVGAGLAAGRDVSEMEAASRALQKKDIVRLNRRTLWPFGIRQKSLFRGDATRSFVARFLGDVTWDDLVIPLAMNAVDVGSAETVWFGHQGDTSLSVTDAVYASSALPVLYPPLEVGGRVLVDGGLLDTLPLARARDLGAQSIIAVDAGASSEADSKAVLRDGLVGLNQRMFVIMSGQRRREIISRDYGVPVRVIRPPIGDIDGFDFSSIGYFLDEGYRATLEAFAP